MAYDITLEGKNMKRALRLLERTVKVFDDLGVQYWLESGTLLGVIREDGLLPWDNDVDLSVMNDQHTKFYSLYARLKKDGFRVRVRKYEEDTAFAKAGQVRIMKVREKHFFGFFKGKVCLDVFVKYEHDNQAFQQIRETVYAAPASFFKTFKKHTFNNYSYSIPEKTEDYLAFKYGKDWKTPKKEWDIFKDDMTIEKK